MLFFKIITCRLNKLRLELWKSYFDKITKIYADRALMMKKWARLCGIQQGKFIKVVGVFNGLIVGVKGVFNDFEI